MGQLVEKLQSIKIVIGLALILLAKVDFYLVEKATENGVNQFIIWVLGFVFAARVAEKFIYKQNRIVSNAENTVKD